MILFLLMKVTDGPVVIAAPSSEPGMADIPGRLSLKNDVCRLPAFILPISCMAGPLVSWIPFCGERFGETIVTHFPPACSGILK